MSSFIFVFLFGLCWGSFLNVVGSRLVNGKSLLAPRSACPFCHTVIAWYDLFPVLSWLFLRGKCRKCSCPISPLYAFVELTTAIILTLLYSHYFPLGIEATSGVISLNNGLAFAVYALFFSSLIVSVRTDLHALIVFQVATLWLIPFGFVSALLKMSNVTITESLLGAFLGYGALWLISTCFKALTKKDGIGEGDFEIVALIGAFLGPLGAWLSVMLGSVIGLIFGIAFICLGKQGRGTRIPFVPFLAAGALLFFFFEQELITFFLS